jgi:uncharacterized membrane protein
MQAFETLFQRHPLVFFHLVTAFAALVLGIVILTRRKGTFDHRLYGWAWVVLMGSTALASAFLRSTTMPNIDGITPIHLFTLTVAVLLPRAVWQARSGQVAAHRKTMKGLFIGGCVMAGVFTLLPGRFLGGLLLQQWAALAS